MKISTITRSIGNTPLVEITHLDDMIKIYAKAEYLNPGGSTKDRVALYMIEQAKQRGEIDQNTTLIEATSGNTGVGLAMVCATMRLGLILTMPESMSIERRKLLNHLGAKIVLTPSEEGMSGSVRKAEELAEGLENSFLVKQFVNPDNPQAHYETTVTEILNDLPQGVDIFVAGVGSGGTIEGIGKKLKEIDPDTLVVAVEPTSSAVLSGGEAGLHAIQGIGAGFVPKIVDTEMIDQIITIEDNTAIQYAKKSARQAGLLVGISSGANLAAAHILAKRSENRGKTIVTILPDTAERYLSTDLFS